MNKWIPTGNEDNLSQKKLRSNCKITNYWWLLMCKSFFVKEVWWHFTVTPISCRLVCLTLKMTILLDTKRLISTLFPKWSKQHSWFIKTSNCQIVTEICLSHWNLKIRSAELVSSFQSMLKCEGTILSPRFLSFVTFRER